MRVLVPLLALAFALRPEAANAQTESVIVEAERG